MTLGGVMLFPMLLTGCPGFSLPLSKSSRVVDDNAKFVPFEPMNISVTSNDEPGTSLNLSPILDPYGMTIAFNFEEYDLAWDHVEIKKQPSSGTAVVVGSNIVYTNNGDNDSDSFEYTAYTQLGDAGSAIVSVQMLEPGSNLARSDGPYSLPPGGGLLIDVLKNDLGTELEIVSVTAPKLGRVEIDPNSGGLFPRIPKIWYIRGNGGQYESGIDAFTYTITGGSTASVSVVIKGFDYCAFVNRSENVQVQFKVDATSVTDGTATARPLVLRPYEGGLGAYLKRDASASVTVVAETIPALPGTPVQWTGQLGFNDRIIFNEFPTPTLTKENPNGP